MAHPRRKIPTYVALSATGTQIAGAVLAVYVRICHGGGHREPEVTTCYVTTTTCKFTNKNKNSAENFAGDAIA